MVNVTIAEDTVVFTVEGLDKLWCFRSRLEIPRSHILDASIDAAQVGRWWHGIRVIGTELPGLFAGGTFRYQGKLVFWDVRDFSKAIIVSLDHERYRKLIVEVANPHETVAALQEAARHRSS
jgi:hypothetical protein